MRKTPKPHKLPSGRWRIRWPDGAGRYKSATYDSHNDAMAAIHKSLVEVHEFKLGLRPAPPPKKTFQELADSWLTTRALHKRSKDADVSRLRAHLTPVFGKLPLQEITYARIEQFKAERAGLAAATLRHLLILLGTMLKHAHRLGWLPVLPPIDKPKVRINNVDYAYLHSAAEIKRFLNAAGEEGADTYAMYATAVYTGLRQGELAALTWDRVELTRRLITVDRSFDGPTKSGDVRRVPILDVLLPILRDLRLQVPGNLLFPNQVGAMFQPKDRIFCERFRRVLTAAGFEKPVGKRQVHYIRFHDMRHTFASHWMMQGGDLFKLQKILGHKTTELTLRYAHLSPDAFAGDLARFDSFVIEAPAVVRKLPVRRVAGGRQES